MRAWQGLTTGLYCRLHASPLIVLLCSQVPAAQSGEVSAFLPCLMFTPGLWWLSVSSTQQSGDWVLARVETLQPVTRFTDPCRMTLARGTGKGEKQSSVAGNSDPPQKTWNHGVDQEHARKFACLVGSRNDSHWHSSINNLVTAFFSDGCCQAIQFGRNPNLTSRHVTCGEGCKEERQNSVSPADTQRRGTWNQASLKSQLDLSDLLAAANRKTASHKLSVPKMAWLPPSPSDAWSSIHGQFMFTDLLDVFPQPVLYL